MNFSYVKKAISIFVALIMVVSCMPSIIFGTTAAASGSDTGIQISVDKSEVTININNVGSSGKASLYRYDANEYFETDSMNGLSKESGYDGDIIGTYDCGSSYTITTKRYQTDGTDNLYSKYYLVQDDKVLLGPCYATDISSLRSVPEFEKQTKKGLHLEDHTTIEEAKSLGISNTVINMDLGSLIIDKDVAQKYNVIEFESNGETYYFDADYIRAQDGLISAYTNEKINVSLVLITWASAETNGKYPEELFYVKGNRQTAGFNTSNEEGMKYWIAAMEFLGKRYSQSSRYGLVNKFIVGNEIDYTYDWYLMQPNTDANGKYQKLDFNKFMEEYSRTLRLANMAVKKYNSESKVVVSFTHNWAENCYVSYKTTGNNIRYNSYAPKEMLDWLSKYEKQRGDYDWGICVHPYPIGTTASNPLTSDLYNNSWQMPVTGDYKTSPWITVSNLELYQQYFELAENKYDGDLRTVSVIEGGICNLQKEDVTAEAYKKSTYEQAGTIAQFYYRATMLECVDEIAYFRIHDLGTTLRLGLREADGTNKPSYNVWKYVDTNKTFNYSNKYLSYIDFTGKATSYKDVMNRVNSGFDWNAAWDESKIMSRTLPTSDDSASLKTDKVNYSKDEPINITATGIDGDIVGLYLKTDDYTKADPIYSYPVSGEHNNVIYKSGSTYNILAYGEISDSRYADADLKAGSYVIAMQDSETGDYITTDIILTSDYSIGSTTASLSTDKDTYKKGEEIIVTASGKNNYWVGIYKTDDIYGSGNATSIYWYYIQDTDSGYISGKPTVIQSTIHNSSSSNPDKVLAPGKYTVYLFEESGSNSYIEIAKKNIEVVSKNLEPLVSLEYELDNETDGFANGTVTVTKDESAEAVTDCVLFWADENEKPLEGYTSLAKFKLEDVTTVSIMTSHTIIPEGAKKLLAYASDGSSISDEYISVDLPENCQYKLSDDYITEFQIVSDTHLTTDEGATGDVALSNTHFKQLLEDVRDNSPESMGIFINGDIGNTGAKAEFDKVLNIYNSVKSTATGDFPELHISIGNHDWIKGNPNSQFQVYAKVFNSNLEKQPENVYYDEVLGGYHFVYLGGETVGTSATLSQEQLDWFDGVMTECTEEDPDKPVFVFLHQSFYSTVSGSLPGQGWHGVNNEHLLKNIMAKYGQIILLNGHSHWELNSESCMYSGDDETPTALNTAAVGYLWSSYNVIGGEFAEGSQGYYVRVYNDKVVFLGRDIENQKFIPSATFIIERNKLDLEKTDYVITDQQEIQTIDAVVTEGTVVNYKSLDADIVTVSDEGAIIPKSLGETKIVVSIEGTDTKVVTRKYVNVKVVEDKSNWSAWVNDPETKTHSRTNLDTGVIETKSCNASKKETVTAATLTQNGKIIRDCSVCKANISTTVIYSPKTIQLSKSSFEYDGKVKTPAVNVVDASGKKIDASNYTVTYDSGRQNVGIYKVTVTFKGNYSGKKVLEFRIIPKAVSDTENVPSITVKTAKEAYVYNGKVITPAISVVDAGGKKVDASNYTVSYAKGRKAVGTYKVIVNFKKNYSGTKTVKFKINPKPTKITSLKAVKKGFTVKWQKSNKTWTKSYQIRYSTSSKFKKAKIVTVKGLKNISKTITKLKANKKYYVQVRTVKNNCYSTWSKAKSVKTKK